MFLITMKNTDNAVVKQYKVDRNKAVSLTRQVIMKVNSNMTDDSADIHTMLAFSSLTDTNSWQIDLGNGTFVIQKSK